MMITGHDAWHLTVNWRGQNRMVRRSNVGDKIHKDRPNRIHGHAIAAVPGRRKPAVPQQLEGRYQRQRRACVHFDSSQNATAASYGRSSIDGS